MPKIQEIIEAHMGKPVTKITAPEEAVVNGAAILVLKTTFRKFNLLGFEITCGSRIRS